MSSYQGEAFDRITVQDALDIIGGFVRDGMPLISWEIRPRPVQVEGHVGRITHHDTPDQVSDTVCAYAERLGVTPEIRYGADQDTIAATTLVRGIKVEVWGVVARHAEGGAR